MPSTRRLRLFAAALALWLVSAAAVSASAPPDASAGEEVDVAQIASRCVQHLLSAQEGDHKDQWPYEGVYRVKGEIPIGYRIGGTAICGMALTIAPQYANDPARQQAVQRALGYIVSASQDPLMSPEYDGGYDVRGWGYTYGLLFLMHLKASQFAPAGMGDDIDRTARFFVTAIERTEIPRVGGWNYARRAIDAVSPPSPFMTGPTLQALFAARAMGFQVNPDVVERALDSIAAARTPTGSVRYSGVDGNTRPEPVPGSIGRMLVTETTLHLAGRGSIAAVRGALDAFIVHWEWLNKRRAQQGTHVPPYGVAPYYFFYAHYYAAQAVEQLPAPERAEYRRRINGLLVSVRLDNGLWNDRVFERSSCYGTAMATMAVLMPDAPPAISWNANPVAVPVQPAPLAAESPPVVPAGTGG